MTDTEETGTRSELAHLSGGPLPGAFQMKDKQTRGDSTGAGAEAAEGIHSADHPRTENKNTALENLDKQADGDKRRGSGPTVSHTEEHQSGYGGGGENGGA